ncbi:hypothetical protein K7X08_015605 [Anisodus acutangulus]|uniref:Uncharacterized protein n=1 Tax=Anisodus acutangulus TaxID=402998 RepID=A0A9Q1QX91_9SOLA|nr:hypothetical protein K7X08_015605 [Anisodus acutangulus]
MEIDEELRRRNTKRKSQNNIPESSATAPEKVHGGESPSPSGISVSLFDYSVENHFKAVDTISKLTGVPEIDDTDKVELNRLASSITFLAEWRYLNYERREVKFACENENSKGKDVIGELSLPQFSSAEVPKKQLVNEQPVPKESSKDFVMYVGGLVWGMDWCPQAYENRDAHIKSEFVAIAPYPPDSSHHKIGAPLTGRGVIQIWCLLDLIQKDSIVKEDYLAQANKKTNQDPTKREAAKRATSGPQKPKGRPRKNPDEAVKGESSGPKKPRGRPRKNPDEAVKVEASGPRKPRGRPRKKPVTESLGDRDCDDHNLQPLAIEYPQQSTELPVDLSCGNMIKAQVDFGQNQEGSVNAASLDSQFTASKRREVRNKARSKGQTENSGVTPLIQDVAEESPVVSFQTYASNGLVSAGSNESGASAKRRKKGKQRTENQTHDSTLPLLTQDVDEESPNMSQIPESPGIVSSQFDENGSHVMQHIPTDVSLPRMVLCLAHNGKVARDVKWRPLNHHDVSRHRMGYLAVILGNGALEVWEVPFLHTIKAIYPSLQKKGTDPRFLKLQPVFRCSRLTCCDGQSIPLTVEWSASPPHDMILVGYHDGVVALWKFSANNSSKDTRPLLCFSADTGPIRALSWAPFESDSGSANIIITAGHKGLKFWDLRDPFRPLRDYNVGQGVNISGVDWLPEPRFIVISCDDGTLKILSLPKAAYDVPVTGNLLVGTKQQGFHNFTRSLLAIWSVQASPVTGMVAYCGADGTAAWFQMTSRMENDAIRNRTPHFLCGSFSEAESGISVVTPVPNIPFRMIYSGKQWRDAIPRSPHGVNRTIEQSDQQPLALCYGNDPNVEGGSDDELVAQKSNQTSKTKSKTTSKSTEAEEEEPRRLKEKFEVLPPKNLSINRVRWNINKGSERWLCYGGTAGEAIAKESKIHCYGRSFNAFAARLFPDEADRLSQKEGVVSVFQNTVRKLRTTRSWDFIGMPKTVQRNHQAETNTIVAVFDTASESPNEISPADFEGHGTHTSSTAAGVPVPGANLEGFASDTARGAVPSARIAAYKVCWLLGCLDINLLAAFDAAIHDGVDIISVSIGGPSKNFFKDSMAIGSFHAMKKGILISCSAGNDGPDLLQVENVAPWIMIVGYG